MAVTADEVLVRMSVQHQDYMNKMRQAEQSAAKVNQQLKVLHDTTKIPLRGPTSQWAPMEQGVRRVNTEMRNLQFNTANIFAQFNDIGVTAAMGMNPMMIALQQGTQLAQAFAGQKPGQVVRGLGSAFAAIISPTTLFTLGAVAAAGALIQFGLAAVTTENDAESLQKRLDALSDAVEKLRSADEMLRPGNLKKIAEEYGIINEQVLSLVRAERELAEVNAMRELAKTMEAIQNTTATSWFNLPGSWAFDDQTNALVELQTAFKITRADAESLYYWFQQLSESSPGSPEQVEALSTLRDYFLIIAKAGREGSDEALRMANMIQDGATEAQILAALTGQLPGAFSAAAMAAAGIADELNRAVAAADALRMAGISDLRRAQIELEYRTDPVGRAGAIAGAKFDEQVGTNMDFHDFNRRKAEVVAVARETAVLTEEVKRLNEQDREAAKKSSGGGAARAAAGLDDSILKSTAALNAEADALEKIRPGWDRYGNSVERARKEAELLQQAENKGIPITDELRQRVSSLGEAWEEAADRQAVAQERLERIKSTSQEVANSLRSAFDGLFDDPIESLKRLGEELAMIALKMTLAKYLPNVFGIGGFMDLGYSGRSIGGYTGAGGVNQPAGVVHKGEVVWSQHDIYRAGGVATVEAMRLGLRGYASGGAVDMSGFSPVGRGGGSDFILIDQREASAPEIETKTQRGPNGQEQVIAIVKKEWARGGFDSVAAARQGTGTRRVVR